MTSLLIRAARLVPVEPADRLGLQPVDVLVRDGVVAEVGPGLTRPSGVDEHDAEGRWLMPGLWDSHVHLGQWTLARQRLDTSRVGSVEEAVDLVAHQVSERPGTPVIGWGHRPGTWDREPRAADLDLAAGVTPVVLVA
ncbi:amidohydrolase family protein, partial [Nocardioides stalactiti]|uniref:amidohydrolase family protein n=1 Tax=Nocardioides stalactiti TaxID=2755356 RepID=UPI001600053E